MQTSSNDNRNDEKTNSNWKKGIRISKIENSTPSAK